MTNILKTKNNVTKDTLEILLKGFTELCKQRNETLHVVTKSYIINHEPRWRGFKITPDGNYSSFWTTGFNNAYLNIWDLTSSKLSFDWMTQKVQPNLGEKSLSIHYMCFSYYNKQQR